MNKTLKVIFSLLAIVAFVASPILAEENDSNKQEETTTESGSAKEETTTESGAQKEETTTESGSAKEEIKDVKDVVLGAVELGTKFKKNGDSKVYTVVELDTDKIYLHALEGSLSQKLSIKHFEVTTETNGKTTWRKFVNLNELCSQTNICENEVYSSKKYGDEVTISRRYKNRITDYIEGSEIKRTIYYTTNHYIGTNKFSSALFVDDGYGSTPSEAAKNTDRYGQTGTFYVFGNLENGDVISEKLNPNGELNSTLVDVESFIDSTNQVYISLRFLSEALGARVDWLSRGEAGDPDDVLIRFYDDNSYCKNIEITHTESKYNSQQMYEHLLEKANKGENYSTSLDISYNYWDNNVKNILKGTAKWKNLYLSGNAVKYNVEMKDGRTEEAKLVEWFSDKDDVEDSLKKRLHFYGETQSPEGETSRFISACPDNVENNKLTSLEGCIDITGIIMYYGVPIPINIIEKEPMTCALDPNTFEK